MEREDHFFDIPVSRVMTREPRVIEPDALAAAAVYRMETHRIMALPVVGEGGRLLGIVHLHDLLRANAV
jgi:arabinose-5-phosphate isomerase